MIAAASARGVRSFGSFASGGTRQRELAAASDVRSVYRWVGSSTIQGPPACAGRFRRRATAVPTAPSGPELRWRRSGNTIGSRVSPTFRAGPAGLAQLAEHRTCNAVVVGSIPTPGSRVTRTFAAEAARGAGSKRPTGHIWPQRVHERSDGGCRLRLLSRHHVGVGVERERHRGVTETLADDLHVDHGGEELRRVRVPQVVETDAREGNRPVPLSLGTDEPIAARDRSRPARLHEHPHLPRLRLSYDPRHLVGTSRPPGHRLGRWCVDRRPPSIRRFFRPGDEHCVGRTRRVVQPRSRLIRPLSRAEPAPGSRLQLDGSHLVFGDCPHPRAVGLVGDDGFDSPPVPIQDPEAVDRGLTPLAGEYEASDAVRHPRLLLGWPVPDPLVTRDHHETLLPNDWEPLVVKCSAATAGSSGCPGYNTCGWFSARSLPRARSFSSTKNRSGTIGYAANERSCSSYAMAARTSASGSS